MYAVRDQLNKAHVRNSYFGPGSSYFVRQGVPEVYFVFISLFLVFLPFVTAVAYCMCAHVVGLVMCYVIHISGTSISLVNDVCF